MVSIFNNAYTMPTHCRFPIQCLPVWLVSIQIDLPTPPPHSKISIPIGLDTKSLFYYALPLHVTCYLLLITVSFESTNNDVTNKDFVLYIFFQSNVLQTYNPDRYR